MSQFEFLVCRQVYIKSVLSVMYLVLFYFGVRVHFVKNLTFKYFKVHVSVALFTFTSRNSIYIKH